MNLEQREIEGRQCWTCEFNNHRNGHCSKLDMFVHNDDSCPAHAFRPKNCSMCRFFAKNKRTVGGDCLRRDGEFVRERAYCDLFQDIPKDKCGTCAYYVNRGVVGGCKLHDASTTSHGGCEGHRMAGSVHVRDVEKDGYPSLSAMRSGRVRAITEDRDGNGVEVAVGPKLMFTTKEGAPLCGVQYWISVKDEDSD